MMTTHPGLGIFLGPPRTAKSGWKPLAALRSIARAAAVAATLGLSAYGGMRLGAAGAPGPVRVADGSGNAAHDLAHP